MPIIVSETAKQKIKEFESFSPEPYDDLGVPAIGYGQRGFDPSLKSITKEQADTLLDEHLAKLKQSLDSKITRNDLTQEQQDAIIDVAYNMGIDKLENKYDFFNRVNSGNDDDVAEFLRTANKARVEGELKELPGLTKRANWRYEAWSSGSRKRGSSIFDQLIAQAEASDLEPEEYGPEPMPEIQAPDMDKLIQMSEMDSEQPMPKDQSTIGTINDIADINDAREDSRAQSLADRLGITKEEAQLELGAGDENYVLMRRESETLKQSFPAIFESAQQDPITLAILRGDLDGAKAIEAAAKTSSISPISIALDNEELD